jgi:hypothetical protein
VKLNTVGASNHQTGYGRMAMCIYDALADLGVELHPGTESADDPAHANGLWMGAPSHIRGFWEGQMVHCLTMWEATGVPPGFRENVHDIDTIIVPSQQNVELFTHWHGNVRKVPLGIDPTDWHYRERPPVESEFRFLTTGHGSRKGIDLTVRAFNVVFGGFQPSATKPIPTLLVKSRHRQDDVFGERVTLNTGTVPAKDEIEVYAKAHCYVGMARGEGWGLMPFQAMAQGCPTILSDAHGHAEFSHLASAQIGCGLSKAEPFIFGDADMWWEPDFDELCEAMWDMYLNYDEYLPKAKHSAQVIADEYTWSDTARKLIEAMGGETALTLPDLTERKWHVPEVQLFPIITNRDCRFEVNGTVYNFKKGELYHEFGDLKRMAFELDYLDPTCLEDPNECGLTVDQLSRLDRYKAQHSRCYACGQRLNSDDSLDFDDDDVQVLVP